MRSLFINLHVKKLWANTSKLWIWARKGMIPRSEQYAKSSLRAYMPIYIIRYELDWDNHSVIMHTGEMLAAEKQKPMLCIQYRGCYDNNLME